MGNDILLKQTSPNSYTYRIKNRTLFVASMSSPFSVDAMPEGDESTAMIMKLEGNLLTMTIEWDLVDYSDELETVVDELTGSSAVITEQDQFDFLLSTMQNKSFEHQYQLSLVQAGTTTPIDPPFSKEGAIQLLTITQSAKDGLIYHASMVFIVGDVLVVANSS